MPTPERHSLQSGTVLCWRATYAQVCPGKVKLVRQNLPPLHPARLPKPNAVLARMTRNPYWLPGNPTLVKHRSAGGRRCAPR